MRKATKPYGNCFIRNSEEFGPSTYIAEKRNHTFMASGKGEGVAKKLDIFRLCLGEAREERC